MAGEFDLEGARKAGYSDAEITGYLAEQRGFDLNGARQAGYSDEDIFKRLTTTPGDFSRGAQVALGQTVPLMKGVVGLAGATAEKMVGEGGYATKIKNWGLTGAQEGMDKLQPLQDENDDVTVAWNRAKEGDLGAMVDWAQYALGYGMAQMAESAVVGVAGAAVGGALGGGVGAAPGAVAGIVGREATKGLIRQMIEREVARRAGEGASEAAVKAATKSVARDMGAVGALTGYNVGIEAGTIYPDAVEQAQKEGRELTGSDLARVWGASLIAGASETVPDVIGLGAIAGRFRNLIPGEGRAARAAYGATGGAALESGQEAFQTLAERVGAGQNLTDDEAVRDYINSAAMAALPGGLVGGVAGALHRPLSEQPPAPTEPPAPPAQPLGLPAPVYPMGGQPPFNPDQVRQSMEATANADRLYAERDAEEQRVAEAFDHLNLARSPDEAIDAAMRAAGGPVFESEILDAASLGESAIESLPIGSQREGEFAAATEQLERQKSAELEQMVGQESADAADRATAVSAQPEPKTAMQLAFERATLQRMEALQRLNPAAEPITPVLNGGNQDQTGKDVSEQTTPKNSELANVRVLQKPIGELTDAELKLVRNSHRSTAIRRAAGLETERRAAVVASPDERQSPPPPHAQVAGQTTPGGGGPLDVGATPQQPAPAPTTAPLDGTQPPPQPGVVKSLEAGPRFLGKAMSELTVPELQMAVRSGKTPEVREAAIAEFKRRQTTKQPTPQVPPLAGMTPLGAKPAPQPSTATTGNAPSQEGAGQGAAAAPATGWKPADGQQLKPGTRVRYKAKGEDGDLQEGRVQNNDGRTVRVDFDEGPDGNPAHTSSMRPESLEYLPEAPAAPAFGNTNRVFTADAAARAREVLRKKLSGTAHVGIDPEIIQAGIQLAGYYIEGGARSFADYSAKMVADLGEAVKPHLKSWYLAVRNYPGFENKGMHSEAELENGEKVDLVIQPLTPGAPAEVKSVPKNPATQENHNPVAAALRKAATEIEQATSQGYTGVGNESEGPRVRPEVPGGGGPGPLANVPAGEVQGPEGSGNAGREPQGGRANDDRRDGRPSESGRPTSRGLGSNEGTPPYSPRRGDAGGTDAGQPSVRRDRGPKQDPQPAGPGVAPAGAPLPGAVNFTITEELNLGAGGQVGKYNGNVAAIKLLKRIEAESRHATADEQAILARYVGWGGIKQAFPIPGKPAPQGWEKRAAEIKELLTPEEWAAAARSIQDAHYTSKTVVDAMWRVAQHLGFDGGRVLESSMGVGNFFGLMPADLRKASTLTGVEYDAITARIAKKLYPHANVQGPVGFHEVTLANDHFNLSIGNPPFGDQSLFDPTAKHLKGFSIHNFFFAKAIDKLAPGGLHVAVVSRYLMDAQATTAREYIAHRAELIGAMRLPWTAFQESANTEVVTDIVVLQKMPKERWGTADKSWVNTTTIPDPLGGEPMTVNAYYGVRPKMILGRMERSGEMRYEGDITVQPRKDQDLDRQIDHAMAELPNNVYTRGKPALEQAVEATQAVIPNDVIANYSVGQFFEKDGKLYQRVMSDDGSMRAEAITPDTKFGEASTWGETRVARLRGMVGIRQAARELLKAEALDESDNKLKVMRKVLNSRYDNYVAKYGYLNDQANERVFKADPDAPLLVALEDEHDPGVSAARAKTLGIAPRGSSAKKMPIFRQRVVRPHTRIEKVDTPADGLHLSISEKGRVDIPYIAQLARQAEGEVVTALTEGEKPLVYFDPASKGYELSADYLSGNVKRKYQEAMAAGLVKQAEALKKVFPEDLKAGDIRVRLGAPWVDTDTYERFVQHLLGESAEATIRYVKANGGYVSDISGGDPVMLETRWGTKDWNADELIPKIMNSKDVTVWRKDSEGNRYVDKDATAAANDKADEIRQEFEDWIFKEPAQRERLVAHYNEHFNTNVEGKIDGSYLTLPGKVPDAVIKLRRHQLNAIARSIRKGKVLLDHVVGAGKTYTFIGAIMEKRRLGLAKKPMLAVPNHLVEQWATDFYRLYPGAKILAMRKADFAKQNRQRMLARVATGDWDAVIFSHSSYGFIENDRDVLKAALDKQLNAILEAIELARNTEGKKSRTAAQYQKTKEKIEQRIKALMDKPRDKLLTFQELGVDDLNVDESHEFKNLFFTTQRVGVGGFGNPTGSKKAFDMYIKTQWLLDNQQGRGVSFGTGTPISNSLTELYTLQRYLGREELEQRGLTSLDAWLNSFGIIQSEYESNVTGTKYKRKDRLRRITNAPEVMQMYKEFSDSVTLDDIKQNYREDNNGAEFPVPKPTSSPKARENVTVEASPAQVEYSAHLQYRMEHLKRGEKDNALAILGDGRKAALDMRLVDPSAPDNPTGKTHKIADLVYATYKKNTHRNGTQLVFLDISTPLKHGARAATKYLAQARKLLGDPKAAPFGTLTEQWHRLHALLVEKMESTEDTEEETGVDAIEKFLEEAAEIEAATATVDTKFSVYDDLRQKLIDRGVPAAEVAFIHDYDGDAKKQDLFDQVNAGRIRILMGSTPKMGAGTNVQKKIVGLHHVDVPWRPSDIEQREGRAIRQGNEFRQDDEDFSVEIAAYATERTSDVFFWQTQEQKLKALNSLRKFKGEREIEEVSADAMSAAEMKALASGNPLILEDVQLTEDIRKLEGQRRRHIANQQDIESEAQKYQHAIERLPGVISEQEGLQARREAYVKDPYKGQRPTVDVDGQQMNPVEAKAHIQGVIAKARNEAFEKDAPVREKLKAIELKAGQMEDKKSAEFQALEKEYKDVQEKSASNNLDWKVTVAGKEYKSEDGAMRVVIKAAGDVDPINMSVGKEHLVRRRDIEEKMQPILDKMAKDDHGDVLFGHFGAVPVSLRWMPARGSGYRAIPAGVRVDLGSEFQDDVNQYQPRDKGGAVIGEQRLDADDVVRKAETLLAYIPSKLESNRSYLRQAQKGLEPLKADIGKKWPRETELERKKARLSEVRRTLAGEEKKDQGAGTGEDQQLEYSRAGPLPSEAGIRYRIVGGDTVAITKFSDVKVEGLKDNFYAVEASPRVWYVIHADTGLSMGTGKTKAEALKSAHEKVERFGLEKVSEIIAKNDALTDAQKLSARKATGRFKRSTPSEGLGATAVRQIAKNLRQRWANAPDIIVLDSMEDAPQDLKDLDARQRAGGAEGTPEAFIHQDRIYLLGDELHSARDVYRAIFHEVLGHYGLRGAFGESLDGVLDDVARSMAGRVRAKAKEYGLDMGKVEDRREAAEEVLAELAQSMPNAGVVRRAIAAIREFLRSIGVDLELSDNDIIANFILPARAFVERGEQRELQAAPAFSRRAAWIDQMPPETQEALRKAGTFHVPPTLKERVAEWKGTWAKRVRQGLVDQFDPIKQYSYVAYMLARMTRGADAALEAVLNYGTIKIDQDGAVDVDYQKGGFLKFMRELKGEHDRFFAWVVGNRAERLLAEGKEHNLTADEIRRLKGLATGQMPDGSPRMQLYMRVKGELDRYNKSILDVAERAGLIDGASRAEWEKDFYVPFYRLLEDRDEQRPIPQMTKGLVNQYAFKTLKGGAQALGDPLENVLKNWSHLIDASLRNQAAKASLEAAARVGAAIEADERSAKEMSKSIGQRGGAVSVLDEGKARWFVIEDPFLLDAMRSIGFMGFSGPAMKALGAFKRWLTAGVTNSPTFRTSNVIRDSIQMIGTNPASYNVLDNLVSGWKSTKEGSPELGQLLAGGGVMRFGSMLEGDRAIHVKRLIDAGVKEETILNTPGKVKAMLQSAWDYWQHIGDRSENLNRAALYKTLRAQGKSHLEASFAARDTMDFSMQGTWAAIRFLVQTVPFMNARLQGLYKLGRGAAEDPRRFGIVIGGAALASIALLLAYKDDPDWKQREEWDRDTYWWFKIGDKAYRIPKPFEIGAIASLAERGLEALITNELTGKQFLERIGSLISQQLSMNPVPQMLKPMIEVYANRNSFTDRPIETSGMERLSKSQRIAPGTSATAQLAGKAGVLSPVQIDHLVRGYFGWLGSHIVSTADLALRPAMNLPGEPAWKIDDVLVAGDFVKDVPAYQSKYMSRLYDQMHDVQQAMADLKNLQQIGATEQAAKMLEEQRDKIKLYRLMNHAEKQLSAINHRIKLVQQREADPQAKREQLDMLYAARNRVARVTEERAREARQ